MIRSIHTDPNTVYFFNTLLIIANLFSCYKRLTLAAQGCFMNTFISPFGYMLAFLPDCYAYLLSVFSKNAQNIPFEHLHIF